MTTRHAVLFQGLLLGILTTAATPAARSAEAPPQIATCGPAVNSWNAASEVEGKTTTSGGDELRAAVARTATGEDSELIAAGVAGHRAQDPILVSMPPLVYPALAKQANAAGLVRVKLLVGQDGRVLEAHAVSGPFLLRSFAEKTIRQWRYRPAVLNSHPIAAAAYANLSFHL